MNPINNSDNELQKAIDDITKNTGQDKGANTEAARELEAKIQNGMGVPPMPSGNGLPPMPGGKNMGNGANFEEMAMPSAAHNAMNASTRGSASMMGVQSGAAAAVANMGGADMDEDGRMRNEKRSEMMSEKEELGEVRQAMMHDLFPLMDKVEMSAEKKYELYHEMLEATKDESMVPAAYDVVKGIADDKERAEALLYLLEFTEK